MPRKRRVEADIRCRNRTILWKHYDFLPKVPYLRTVVPCGRVREWVRREFIPKASVECKCGELDYRHWFILYTDEKGA